MEKLAMVAHYYTRKISNRTHKNKQKSSENVDFCMHSIIHSTNSMLRLIKYGCA